MEGHIEALKALFCNGHEVACGVAQFGANLASILSDSTGIDWDIWIYPYPPEPSRLDNYDVILYNYQGLMGGWMALAPFSRIKAKQVLCYHDLDIKSQRWDAILFSDPTLKAHDNWHPIGRPIPEFKTITPQLKLAQPIVGVHGFLGAWSNLVVSRVMEEFETATIRLHLPYSKFCDPNGDQARSMADLCRKLVERSDHTLLISHEFMPQPKLLEWLSQNDINCYFRPAEMHWRGVSSAPDMALAVRKPIAVNNCNAFRHLHGTSPTITVEESSLAEIIRNGLTPLVPIYQQWSPERIRAQVEAVLYRLTGKG